MKGRFSVEHLRDGVVLDTIEWDVEITDKGRIQTTYHKARQ